MGVQPTETAVIVVVPAAEEAVGEHRRRLDVAASWGVPPHVTVLYPFVAPSELDDTVVARLRQALAVVPAFWCSFDRCGWFGNDVLYLAPVPAEPFRALTAAVWREFPQHPPYGGAYAEVVPHLTVGERASADVRALEEAEVAVTSRLPVRALVDRVSVIAGAPMSGSWHTTHQVTLPPGP